MSEYKAFKELIKKYRSITRADIAKLVDEGSSWDDIKNKLTGFGRKATCILCRDVNGKCRNCDWVELTGDKCDMPSSNNCKTYRKINWARTIEDLYQAYQDRADYMEKVLKENEKDEYRRFSSVENVLKAILDGRKLYIKRELNQKHTEFDYNISEVISIERILRYFKRGILYENNK